MATLALAIFIPGGLGAIIPTIGAYALTTYVDQRFILPTLFPQPDAPKPKIGDLDFQFAEEGALAPYALGSVAPCKGGLIWMSGLIVEPIEQDTGGCGGGSTVVGYRYFAHVQILICECDPVDGISDVKRVWKNGKVFYERDSDVAISSNQISAVVYESIIQSGIVTAATNASPIRVSAQIYIAAGEKVRITGATGNTAANGDWIVANVTTTGTTSSFDLVGSTGNGNYDYLSGTAARLLHTLELRSSAIGPDITALRIGVNATIAGFTSPATADNGTFKVLEAGNITAGGTYARFEMYAPVAKAAGDPVTINQTVPPWNLKDAIDVHFTDGSNTEVPDPLVEGIEGAGNVPAYRGRATMVVEKLRLDGPGQMPEFRFLVEEQQATVLRSQAISKIMLRAGYEADQFDVTEVDGSISGVAVTGAGTSNDVLQPLAIAYDILAQQRDAKIHFFDRVDALVVDVEEDDLGTHESSDEPAGRLVITDPPDSVLPDEVTIQHFDPALDYQTGSQRERKHRAVSGHEIMPITVPVVLSAQDARGVVRRSLWICWSQRKKISLTLPPSYCYLREGNVIETTAFGEDWRILLRRVDVGANYLVKCEGEIDDPVISAITAGPADPPLGQDPPSVSVPGEAIIVLANLPPILTSFVGKLGMYYQTALADENEPFDGITIYDSSDDVTFSVLEAAPAEGTIGVTTTALLGNGVDRQFRDMVSTVTVKLKNGTLSSTTYTLLKSGANRILVGNEVIAFMTATVVDTDTYQLSGLLRGLYDTQDEMSRHFAGERVMLLNGQALRFVEMNASQVGFLRYYRPVTTGQPYSVATSAPFTIDYTSRRHWTPCTPKIQRDSTGGSLLISWKRRCLGPIQVFQGSIPLYDTIESYEVEVYDDDTFTTMLRVLPVSDAEEVLYTDTDQTTDFGGVQTSLNLLIYQINSSGERSKALVVENRPFDTAIA